MFKLSKLAEIAFAASLYYSGLVMLARWWTQRSGQKMVILCYHRADSKNLRGQMMYLRRAYRVLHLDAALEELYTSQRKPLPQRTNRTLLTLTFDDGYQDNYTYGFGLVRELRVPITIFLVSDYLERRRPFAWLAGEDNHLVPYAQVKEATIHEHTYSLANSEERAALAQEINNRARFTSSVAEREEYLGHVREALAVSSTFTQGEQRDMPLTWDEVHEMEASKWVSFGAHTVHHPILTCLTDAAEARYEVAECRKEIENRLGHPIRAFAYPYGKPEQVGEIGPLAVREAHYDWAVTTVHGLNTAQTDRYLLHRIVVDAHDHWLVLAVKASGLWDACMNVVRKPLSIVAAAFGLNPPYNPYR